MRFSALASLLLSASLALATATPRLEERAKCPTGIRNPSKVKNAFTKSGVVPTLIPKIAPKVQVNVAYGTKKVSLGNKFTTAETVMAPTYSFTNEPGYTPGSTNYSFFMIDPDVPNPQSPARVTFLHWYVAHNLPSCESNSTADTVTIYESPTPGSTQQHRYTFLVYREPAGYVPDVITDQARPGFDVVSYAKQHGLVLIGGNYLLEAVTNT